MKKLALLSNLPVWLRLGMAGAAGCSLLLALALGSLHAQHIKAPAKLAELQRLISMREGPGLSQLDQEMAAAGLAVRSMIPELACTSDGPSGPITHVPVQISEQPGGRQSVLSLQVGQSTTAGIYVAAGKIYERHVSRRTGAALLAVGDVLDERITEPSGSVVQDLSYRVTAIDHRSGSFRAVNDGNGGLKDGDIVNTDDGWCWSCNGGSSWWCGFPCAPDLGTEGPITAKSK